MKNFTLFISLFILSLAGYAAPPVISGFAPTTAEKGKVVIITGSGFTAGATVSFGGTPAASVLVVSSTHLRRRITHRYRFPRLLVYDNVCQ